MKKVFAYIGVTLFALILFGLMGGMWYLTALIGWLWWMVVFDTILSLAAVWVSGLMFLTVVEFVE